MHNERGFSVLILSMILAAVVSASMATLLAVNQTHVTTLIANEVDRQQFEGLIVEAGMVLSDRTGCALNIANLANVQLWTDQPIRELTLRYPTAVPGGIGAVFLSPGARYGRLRIITSTLAYVGAAPVGGGIHLADLSIEAVSEAVTRRHMTAKVPIYVELDGTHRILSCVASARNVTVPLASSSEDPANTPPEGAEDTLCRWRSAVLRYDPITQTCI